MKAENGRGFPMTAAVQVRIGTSGWIYRHWRGVVYPSRLRTKDWFGHYAALFGTVEINNSFYRLPSEEAFDAWAHQAPLGFLYAVKASRFLTHMKKLKDPEGPLALILGRARRLGAHLGPILYQLPPHWRCDVARLRSFLELLPPELCHVFEFRDPSWYTDAVRDALTEHGACFCIHDLRGADCPEWLTGPAVYLRFHGPTEQAYAGGYPRAHLRRWAERIAGYVQAGRDVFAYFNNDDAGHAVADAQTLRSLVNARMQAVQQA
jgi:uncharacterized protein YecE (DUF72 family)